MKKGDFYYMHGFHIDESKFPMPLPVSIINFSRELKEFRGNYLFLSSESTDLTSTHRFQKVNDPIYLVQLLKNCFFSGGNLIHIGSTELYLKTVKG